MNQTIILSKIECRYADFNDCLRVLMWRNHDDVREISRNTEKISLDEHATWFSKVLNKSSDEHLFWIFEERGRPLGMVRFDRMKSDTFEISIVVDPIYHGVGIGKVMLSLAMAKFKKMEISRFLSAAIHKDNLRSVHLFESFNFKFKNSDGNFLLFTRKI
jgi:UDP-2,4-diacetamido-2,4,6-trideoxy-beta-L-altropyranose hydrolase